jgi:hypothetical protein
MAAHDRNLTVVTHKGNKGRVMVRYGELCPRSISDKDMGYGYYVFILENVLHVLYNLAMLTYHYLQLKTLERLKIVSVS